jgi:hypothetical protein
MNRSVKVRLLNYGCYGGMEQVKFPAEVDAIPFISFGEIQGYDVSVQELASIGYSGEHIKYNDTLLFMLDANEVELVD